MAVVVTRRAGSGSTQANVSGSRSESITYTVSGVDTRTLKSDIMSGNPPDGIPAFGDAHPELPGFGLIARGYSFSEGDTGDVTDVTVAYTTGDAGVELLYSQPDLSGNQSVFSASFGVRMIEIPIAVLDTYTINDLTGTPKDHQFWRIQTKKVPESYSVVQARWQLAGKPLDFMTIQIFESQHNTIHQIGGRRYLFSAGAITPRDNNTFEITGSWTSDNGTAAQASTDITKYNMPTDMGYVDGSDPASIWPFDFDLMRSPFHSLGTVPSEDPNSVIVTPLVYQTLNYKENLNGWRMIPGIPF